MPLSSRRNTNNFAPPTSSAGLRLPQAASSHSTQHQLVQQNGTTLYSPRISNGSMHHSNYSISPRGTLRGSRKDFATQLSLGRSNQPNLAAGTSLSTSAQQSAYAAAVANRPSLAQLKQVTSQKQLFGPRQDMSAAKGALTACPDLQRTAEASKAATHAQHVDGSLTCRPQHAQQAPTDAEPAQQPVQPLVSSHSPSRSFHHLCIRQQII